MLLPEHEQRILQGGFGQVIGIDEAGRGAWAGPVAIGFFGYRLGDMTFNGIKDSKLIASQKRQKIFEEIKPFGGAVLKSSQAIDTRGITNVIEEAISEIMTLYPKAYFLIDGRFTRKFPEIHKFVIKGDQTHYSIAAASIIAKESRDQLMRKLSKSFPEYGFESHKGYGTKLHRTSLETHGSTSIHRLSYAPLIKLNSSSSVV